MGCNIKGDWNSHISGASEVFTSWRSLVADGWFMAPQTSHDPLPRYWKNTIQHTNQCLSVWFGLLFSCQSWWILWNGKRLGGISMILHQHLIPYIIWCVDVGAADYLYWVKAAFFFTQNTAAVGCTFCKLPYRLTKLWILFYFFGQIGHKSFILLYKY